MGEIAFVLTQSEQLTFLADEANSFVIKFA